MKTMFMIAAPTSGSGKTTVARRLMSHYARQGLRVQPFKCGPDYIDTKFHEAVCHRPSVNLDTFMATPGHVKAVFQRYSQDADVVIVEGMMGLFDGYDRDRGSTAEVARILQLPVVLVVDARSAAYSLAPLLKGFTGFHPDVHIVGVVMNRVGSPRHAELLRQVCADVGLPCLACLSRQDELCQPSRYLGLDFSQLPPPPTPQTQGDSTVVVARNAESFSFIYQELLDSLGPVTFFDPEREVPSLERCQLLYLPGGYPEKHLPALVAAQETREAIARYARQGGRVVAECGGMMYLCQSIVTDEGEYPMCGVLPYTVSARRQDRRLSLGYRRFQLDGQEYRGHEFHYTQFIGPQPPSACQVYDARGQAVPTPVIRQQNVWASYTHIYLNETNLHPNRR